ncbi:DUF1287 domain-containing protein [uncultured Massilia sp.]|uniref:DUF1287 domain-containing protein n=1 Tax=uncultured Massilia sp. TaxID=169973 RepID=UPI00258D0948|nr:DUF1287 domain-containing protein [uncultured Massilia sp.]
MRHHFAALPHAIPLGATRLAIAGRAGFPRSATPRIRVATRRVTLACTAVLGASLLCIGPATAAGASPQQEVVAAAKEQIGVTLLYDPSYKKLAYPLGDVPAERGVCTDVVIRALRHIGIDLQERVYRDMKAAWKAYPYPNWGLKRPDPNIDHRRVPNLAVFFTRHGQALPASKAASDYAPSDIVTWTVPPGVPHIGIVADVRTPQGVPLVIHHIGAGTQMEDRLFAWPVTGHYRYRSFKLTQSYLILLKARLAVEFLLHRGRFHPALAHRASAFPSTG